MTLDLGDFKKALYDTYAKETIKPLEDQIDQKIRSFTNLSSKEKETSLNRNDGNILEITHIKNMDKFNDEQQRAIRNSIKEDYQNAGWTISWVPFFDPLDSKKHYMLCIKR